MQNRYYLFLDESGDHGLNEINPQSSVFLLCGVLLSAENYSLINKHLDSLKHHFWANKDVILHSRDIRKCDKEFQILFDLDVKKDFYNMLNSCIIDGKFTVICSAINKNEYIKKFGRISNNVYELCLSFIIERAVFFLDDTPEPNKTLDIIIEKRGAKEDKALEGHFQRLCARGTGFVDAKRLTNYHLTINFRSKKQNINGLQLADLIAYPSFRYVMEPKRANPSFEVFRNKIYSKKGKVYGLKVYP